MQTISTSQIPNSLGAWDSAPQRWMQEGAEQHDADTAPIRDHLLRCLTGALRTGDATDLAAFAKPHPMTKRFYTLAEVVQEGIECADLQEAVVQFLIESARGGDMQAQLLLTVAAAKWSQLESEL